MSVENFMLGASYGSNRWIFLFLTFLYKSSYSYFLRDSKCLCCLSIDFMLGEILILRWPCICFFSTSRFCSPLNRLSYSSFSFCLISYFSSYVFPSPECLWFSSWNDFLKSTSQKSSMALLLLFFYRRFSFLPLGDLVGESGLSLNLCFLSSILSSENSLTRLRSRFSWFLTFSSNLIRFGLLCLYDSVLSYRSAESGFDGSLHKSIDIFFFFIWWLFLKTGLSKA